MKRPCEFSLNECDSFTAFVFNGAPPLTKVTITTTAGSAQTSADRCRAGRKMQLTQLEIGTNHPKSYHNKKIKKKKKIVKTFCSLLWQD